MKKNFDVTILLTVFNRADYTNKWLDYAELCQIPFKILIADGGNVKDIKKKLNLEKRKLNISYKKFQFYKNYDFFFEKFYLAVKKIKTKYIYLAEDDDYIFSNTIKNSVKFLDKNNKFSCVKGINCLGELIRNDNKILSLVLRSESPNQVDNSILSKSSDLRLVEYYKNKHTSIYNALHRRDSLLKTFKILGTRNFCNLYITELIFCLSVIYNGKIARTDCIDYIKMDNTDQSSSNNYGLTRPFSIISSSKEFKEENNLILKSIKFRNKQQKKRFISLHNQFLKKDQFMRIQHEIRRDSFLKKLKKKIKFILIKSKIYYLLKYFYLYFFKSYYVYKHIMIIDKSIICFIKKNKKEFNKIVDFNHNYKF